MRLRRRHAWGAALIALFALPVLRPQGFPSVEGPAASFLGWFARTPALNPRLWQGDSDEVGPDSPRVQALEHEVAQLRELHCEEVCARADFEALRDVLQTTTLDRLPAVKVARVLRATDPSGFRRSLLLDRGSEDGVTEGCAVALGDVFLGRVRIAYGRSALVQLVSDPQARLEVAVRTDHDRRLRGFLHGLPRGTSNPDLEIRFTHVKPGCGAISVGAPVFTSNGDEHVPAGLLVGRITSVSDPDGDGMPILRMRPAMDLDRALNVFVLLGP